MAKVYLSFLGTNDYVDCHYVLGEQESPLVKFVQEALVGFCCRDWTKEDRLVFFLTVEAARNNWEDGHFTDAQGAPKPGLRRRLQGLQLAPAIQPVMIPGGRNEADIWQLFQTVLQQLKPRDEVIVDITHAFRSIPLLAMVVLGYAQVMKQIRIAGIYYGAVEVLGTVEDLRQLPPAQRRAPIFDLTPFSALLDWTLAIDRFLATGDARRVCDLARTSVRPILKETQGRDQEAQAIRRLADLLEKFTINLSTCRGQEIAQNAAELQQALAVSQYPDLLPPLKPLLYQLHKTMQDFTGQTVRDGLRAVRWCLEHNLLQQGFTILQEFLLTHFVSQNGYDPSDRMKRDLASQAAHIFCAQIEPSRWHGAAAAHPDIVHRYVEFFARQPRLAQVYRNLSQPRNDINHAGFVQPRSAGSLAQELASYLGQVEELLLTGASPG